MASPLEEDLTRQEMEESGEMDFIRNWANTQEGETDQTPVEETDTAAEEETVEETVEETEEEVEAGEETDEPEAEEAEEDAELELSFDLTPEVEALLAKYGGDLNKALEAASQAQSLIGRQGNELGDLRKELLELRDSMEAGFRKSEPYPEWPDMEYDEPAEAVVKLRAIAEAAFSREDVQMFASAVEAWQDIDQLGASTYKDLVMLRLQTAAAAPAEQQEDVTALTNALADEYPDLRKAEVQQEIAALAQSRPSLMAQLESATPRERVQYLKDLYLEVASRQTAETVQRAVKRVTVKASEEARQQRREAQVVTATRNRGTTVEETPARVVALGETGQVLDLDRLNSMLDEEDRI